MVFRGVNKGAEYSANVGECKEFVWCAHNRNILDLQVKNDRTGSPDVTDEGTVS